VGPRANASAVHLVGSPVTEITPIFKFQGRGHAPIPPGIGACPIPVQAPYMLVHFAQ